MCRWRFHECTLLVLSFLNPRLKNFQAFADECDEFRLALNVLYTLRDHKGFRSRCLVPAAIVKKRPTHALLLDLLAWDLEDVSSKVQS